MLKFKELIDEGVNDPAIFKAVFLAGGPGSGKSFIVGRTALTAHGFRVVNSDDAFEKSMKDAGLEMNPENIFSDQGQAARKGAKVLTGKRRLGEDQVTKMWKSVQRNIGTFQRTFGQNFYVVDNSIGSDFNSDSMRVYKEIGKWSKKDPRNRIAQSWIRAEKSK